MGWIRPAAIAAGATIAGIGIATQTSRFAKELTAKAGERYWDRQFSPEGSHSPVYYGGSAIFGLMAGVGLAAGAVALLRRPSLGGQALGGAALAAAFATAGSSVGAFSGFSAGKEASVEKHGVNIESHVDHLMKTFDRNPEDGALSTKDDGFPEYLYKYEHKDPYRGSLPDTRYVTIEKFVKAADADGDSKATRQEIVDKFKSYDGNGNGLLSWNDQTRLTDDGMEQAVLEDQVWA